ncbi:hypothetical protein [Alkalihalobacillus sp. TS-13]|uniref:hypothetical protein n=1 Tax=Alkalihalobacillus sp. TS-13 TaxID=2842455 RepID=UPI001C871CE2|nr:hypothetical protein [Alkalihalobacillus sp. TS-13]
MSYGNIGYEPGKGRTFTPSLNASWCESFNQILTDYKQKGFTISRNKLTEKMIEDGLKYQTTHIQTARGEEHVLTVPLTTFSPQEVDLLQSEHGQVILRNVLKLLLGQQQGDGSFLTPTIQTDSGDRIPPNKVQQKQGENISNNTTSRDLQKTKPMNEQFPGDTLQENDVLEKLKRKRKMLNPN